MATPEVVLARMDISALYPSIDQVESERLLRETFIQSDLKVTNIDWRAGGLYQVLTTPREELDKEDIGNFVPRK